MDNKPINPRAFPLPVSDNNMGYEGMTLRDYFAAAALQGFCSNEKLMDLLADEKDHTAEELTAGMAYEQADAMLKARQS